MPLALPLRESVATGPNGLESLASVWKQLWSHTDPPPPMLEYEWVHEWWRLHQAEGELLIVVVADAVGTAIGLAPLYLRHAQLDPARALRSVHFLGTGEDEIDEVCGEYNGWIGSPESAGAVSAAVARTLLDRRPSWDRLRLQRLWPDRGIAKDLLELLAPSLLEWNVSSEPTFRSRALRLDDYIARIPSRKMRSNCRRALKAAAAEGIEFVRSQSVAEAVTMFDAMTALHQRSWTKRGVRGVFASKVFDEFHRRLLLRQQPWIVGLRQNGRWIAVGHHLSVGDRLYAYVAGADMAMDIATPHALSPGLLLHLLSIDDAAASGCRVYDFLSGDYPHKRRLALEQDETLTVECLQSNLRTTIWRQLRDLRRAVLNISSAG